MRIVETFQITGRGLAVAVEESTELPVGRKLLAVVNRPDGSSISVEAYKEWLLRRHSEPMEKETFLLMGLSKSDVPIGSKLQLSTPMVQT